MLCQRVIIINRGRIVAEDSMKHLAEQGPTVSLELEVAGDPAEVTKLLERISGVQRVTHQALKGAYLVDVARDSGARAQLGQALVEAKFGLLSLRERARTLEDVFVEAISSDQPAQVS